jgi:hypothetical protein
MRLIIVLFLLIATQTFFAQSNRQKPKVSYAKGTLFGYWGYNRSVYTKSDIRFVGSGYDFTLKGSSAHDNQAPFTVEDYFSPDRITVPQFNTRIGYYIKNHWAVSFGYDHMKYLFNDKNQVKLNGTINPGVDPVTNWSGNYEDEDVVTNRSDFHYENSNGLNYLRFELTRTDQWFSSDPENKFAISTNLGVGAGGILSFNDFNFAGKKDMVTISLSGYAVSAHTGLRFEFFRNIFLQTNFSGGFMHQVRVKTRPDDGSAYAQQMYGYAEFDVVLGFLFYIKPVNDCNTCPHW